MLACEKNFEKLGAPQTVGILKSVLGMQLVISGIDAKVGEILHVENTHEPLLAEVVAAKDNELIAMPLAKTSGIGAGCLVTSTGAPLSIHISEELQGRVLNGLGEPIDELAEFGEPHLYEVNNKAPNSLKRPLIRTQLSLGVKALDTTTPVGAGQRIGIMAGSGVGKSSLLSMIAKGTQADLSVIALIGERGREVREFIENDLGEEGMRRSVVVVATSDASAVERVRAAFVATRIAEWFRDQGKNVVLMMDSLTRVAMAQREVGLAAGEPPATKGYPPSVFGLLPELLERAGTNDTGSITGLYTVLVEGDDLQDPIGDTARSILDGHVVLSRELATAGHFPSIDVLESISRVGSSITDSRQKHNATKLRKLMAAYRDVKDLVQIGAYVPGTNKDADDALGLWEEINDFLTQSMQEQITANTSWEQLDELVNP